MCRAGGWDGAGWELSACNHPVPSHHILSHPSTPHPVPSHPIPSHPTPAHLIPPAPWDHRLGKGGHWAVGSGGASPFPVGTVHRSRGSVGLGALVGPHHAVGSKWGPTMAHRAWRAGRGSSEPVAPVPPGRAQYPREGFVPAALAPQRSPSAPTTTRSTSTARTGPSGAKCTS